MLEISVQNVQGSSSFYRRLGFEVVRDEGTFLELEWESARFAL